MSTRKRGGGGGKKHRPHSRNFLKPKNYKSLHVIIQKEDEREGGEKKNGKEEGEEMKKKRGK